MTTSNTIVVERSAGVATITLNRPDRLNSITASMGVAFDAAVLEADADPEVRVIVLTGSGRGFCAGADLADLAEESAEGELHPDEGMHPELLLQVRKPVIAAVNGPAAGLGFALMLMADIRIVAADAKLTTSFARLGLVAEYGCSWLLPRLVGVADALDLLFTARKITGADAADMGLAQQAVPADEVLATALAYAEDLARQCSPQSLATIKEQVYSDLARSFPEALERASSLMTSSFVLPDVAEGIAAQAERRTPQFAPLAAQQPLVAGSMARRGN